MSQFPSSDSRRDASRGNVRAKGSKRDASPTGDGSPQGSPTKKPKKLAAMRDTDADVPGVQYGRSVTPPPLEGKALAFGVADASTYYHTTPGLSKTSKYGRQIKPSHKVAEMAKVKNEERDVDLIGLLDDALERSADPSVLGEDTLSDDSLPETPFGRVNTDRFVKSGKKNTQNNMRIRRRDPVPIEVSDDSDNAERPAPRTPAGKVQAKKASAPIELSDSDDDETAAQTLPNKGKAKMVAPNLDNGGDPRKKEHTVPGVDEMDSDGERLGVATPEGYYDITVPEIDDRMELVKRELADLEFRKAEVRRRQHIAQGGSHEIGTFTIRWADSGDPKPRQPKESKEGSSSRSKASRKHGQHSAALPETSALDGVDPVAVPQAAPTVRVAEDRKPDVDATRVGASVANQDGVVELGAKFLSAGGHDLKVSHPLKMKAVYRYAAEAVPSIDAFDSFSRVGQFANIAQLDLSLVRVTPGTSNKLVWSKTGTSVIGMIVGGVTYCDLAYGFGYSISTPKTKRIVIAPPKGYMDKFSVAMRKIFKKDKYRSKCFVSSNDIAFSTKAENAAASSPTKAKNTTFYGPDSDDEGDEAYPTASQVPKTTKSLFTSTFMHTLDFLDEVPIYDVREKNFIFDEASFASITEKDRYWASGVKRPHDLPDTALVAVGYTLGVWGQTTQDNLSPNVVFVLLLGFLDTNMAA